MFIKVEPVDFSMYRVILIFDLESQDSEDQQVRDYLAEHDLEPRYQSTGELDDRQCEFLQFGGCYLGRHLEGIGQIQRSAVEVELLTAEIEGHLDASAGEAFQLPEERRQETLAELVCDFQKESSFQTGENGELIAVLEGGAVREAARQLVGGSSGDSSRKR